MTRRKSTTERRITGNAGHRPMPADAPQYAPGDPEPPTYLPPDALDYWNQIVPDLVKSGALTAVDRGTLIQCSVFWGQYITAVREVQALPSLIYQPPKGYGQPDPWIGVQNTAYTNYQRAAKQLGITPASRSGVRAVKPRRSPNAFESLPGGRLEPAHENGWEALKRGGSKDRNRQPAG